MNSSSVAAKSGHWALALLIGFLSGIAGAILAIPVSDWAMKWHHVSSMEGGRACAAVGIWAPLAFIVSLVVGTVISRLIRGSGFGGFALRLVLALIASAALVLAGGGIGYATADHPPLLNGANLALEIEARVPAKGRTIADLQQADFRIALVVSASDRSYSDLRWSEARMENGFIIVPAWAPLRSRNAGRDIVVGMKDQDDQVFSVVLPASPKQIDESWPEWAGPRQRVDGRKPAPEDQGHGRYRVRLRSEYSPTPTPGSEPEASATPEESSSSE